MPRVLVVAAVACACLVGLEGCGGEPDPLPTPVVEVTLTNLCAEMAEVSCYNMWHCCTGQQIEDALGIAISLEPEDCRRDVELLCQESFATIFWAAVSGSVTVDTAVIDACLESRVLSGDCFQHLSAVPWEETCGRESVRGMLQPGSACVYDWQCVNGSFCAPDARCRSLPTSGQECFGLCSAGLFCNLMANRCEGKRPAGQACYDASFCAQGLYCDFDEEGIGTCAAPRTVGQACDGPEDCLSAYCQPGVCAGTLTTECFRHTQCPGQCATSRDACMSSYDCGRYCAVSRTECYSEYDCPEGQACLADTCDQHCNGQPVCAERWRVVDYCEDTLEIF